METRYTAPADAPPAPTVVETRYDQPRGARLDGTPIARTVEQRALLRCGHGRQPVARAA